MNKFRNIILAVAFVGLFAAACTPTPVDTAAGDADDLVNSFVYVKANNGLCFGVTTVSRVSSGGQYSLTSPVVNVSCHAVGLDK